MDKVKVYLAVLKKHHFWLLIVVALLLSAYGWFAGTKALDAEFASNRSTIESAFSGAQAIKAGDPNPSFKETTDTLHEQQKVKALAAWERLYNRQRENLKWPETVKHIGNMKPKAVIDRDDRQTYWQYFRSEFPKLFSKIEPLEVVADNPGAVAARVDGAPAPAAAANKTKVVGKVDWLAADREALVKRYEWRSVPTNIQVRMAQEDFWIYESLLDIIAAVNKGAGTTSHTNAAINKIEVLKIAQDAFDAGIPVIDGLVKEAFPPAGDSANQPKPASAASTDEELVKQRYVGIDGKPSETASDEGEFKLIPVRMRLVMDQRRIPDFLVACANSPLPVEIRQVRYNPGASTGKSAIGAGGGGGGRPLAPAAAPAGGARAAGGAEKATVPQNEIYLVPVEFRGVIYFFNAPNKEQLGRAAGEGGDEDQAGGDEGADADTTESTETTTTEESTDGTTPAEGSTTEGTSTGEPGAETPSTTEPPPPAEPAADGATPTTPDGAAEGGTPPADTPATDTP
jgi:hypothetical protein